MHTDGLCWGRWYGSRFRFRFSSGSASAALRPLGGGVWHMQEFWGGWYRFWFGFRVAVENGLACCKKRRSCSYRARAGRGVAQEQVQVQVQDVWLAVWCCVPAVLVGVGFLLLQHSGGDMHTCMLVLAGWVQEQVQVKASGGRRERFHSYGKMLYMHPRLTLALVVRGWDGTGAG